MSEAQGVYTTDTEAAALREYLSAEQMCIIVRRIQQGHREGGYFSVTIRVEGRTTYIDYGISDKGGATKTPPG